MQGESVGPEASRHLDAGASLPRVASLAGMSNWRHELKAQVRLATPVITVNLAMMAMGVVDTIMAGDFSTTALAAVGLGHAWLWCPLSFGIGVVMALDPLVAQARGARDEPAVARALQRGLLLALFVSIPVVITLLGARWVFEGLAALDLGQLLGLDSGTANGARAVGPMVPASVIPDASAYARISAIGVPALLVFSALRQTLQALGHLRAILVVSLAANFVNVFFNWLLMEGHWGLPRLGVAGCAWASVIVEIFMVAVLLWVTRPVVQPYLWPIRRQALQLRPFLRLFALGVPIGVA
ncbi:MAG: MATE family multidrug resistance protein, partial [Pseudohongiellaceae bacterium]